MNKKVLLIVSVIILLLVLITSMIFYFNKKDTVKYTTTASKDGKISIDIPSNIKYTQNPYENSNLLIDLYSEKEDLYIYVSAIAKERDLDLLEVVNNDKNVYTTNKGNVKNVSDTININIKDYNAYEYSFTYFDTHYEMDFYSNVIWIETATSFYILNFDVNSTQAEKYKPIFNNIKNSFCEL